MCRVQLCTLVVANPLLLRVVRAGLSATEAGKLASYALFRNAEDVHTLARVRKAGVSNQTDFLDGLSEEKGALMLPLPACRCLLFRPERLLLGSMAGHWLEFSLVSG